MRVLEFLFFLAIELILWVKMNKNTKGFTLVELSIVLVIIGLIVSSILVGQELIEAASIKSQVSQIQTYQASVGTFMAKYRAIPGDFSKATTFGFAGSSGDGDGVLEDLSGNTGSSTTATGEITRFWQHLSEANMADGNYDGAQSDATLISTYPRAKIGRGGLGVYKDGSGFNVFQIGVTNSVGGTVYSHEDCLTPHEAYAIDIRIDDGFPNAGLITARGGISPDGVPSPAPGGVDSCVNTTPTIEEYAVQEEDIQCQIKIRMLD